MSIQEEQIADLVGKFKSGRMPLFDMPQCHMPGAMNRRAKPCVFSTASGDKLPNIVRVTAL